MGTARRVAIALAVLLAAMTSAAAAALWPLVARDDLALVEHVRRDVDFGWLLLQAATPLFALCVLTTIGALAICGRLAMRRATAR